MLGSASWLFRFYHHLLPRYYYEVPPRPLLCVLTALLLCTIADRPALAQPDEWCATEWDGPATPVPAGFQPGPPVEIPVVVHVIYRTFPQHGNLEVGNLSETMIAAQIVALNDRYAATGFTFSLLGIGRIENAAWFEDLSANFSDATEVMNVDPSRVMNIYTESAHRNRAGFANFPTPNVVGTPKDGLFVSHPSFPPNQQGETAVHEAGHYFGLPHTFGPDSTCVGDDGFTDTSLEADGPGIGNCPASRYTCLDGLPDPIHNFMDYASEACRNEFTPQQDRKQQHIRYGIRSELGQNVPTVIDSRSAPVTYTNHTFTGDDIFVLPGADVTISGSITLQSGARLVIAGGADLSGITNVNLQGGSVFDIRGYDAPLAFGDVTVSGGSVLKLGQQQEGDLGILPAPTLTVAGNVTVTGAGSTFEVGKGGELALDVSSVARFENQGRYVTQGTTTLGADAQFVLEPTAAPPEIETLFADPTFALGRDARLVFRNGGYALQGELSPFTVRRLDPNEAWDGIAIDGADITLQNVVIEGGSTGVTVYEPGSVAITNSTLRDNGTGLDVRSSAGTVVSGSVVEQNGVGIESGFIACYGASCPCFGSCRSSLTLERSSATGDSTFVRDNTGVGVSILDTDADITGTRIMDNGSTGLTVSNAYVDPFLRNVIEGNGSYGISVLSGGDLLMSPQTSGNFGLNRVANNASAEVFVYGSGLAFLGNSTGNGRNSVYDTSGGTLVVNTSPKDVDAVNTYWDSFGAPPTGAFAGFSPVVWTPVSDCDYTVTPPVCLAARSPGTGTLAAAEPAEEHRVGFPDGPEALAEAILAVRTALAADASSAEAPALARELGALHRYDHDDELGEWATSSELLGTLRSALDDAGVSAALRATAEAALEVEAVAALGRGDYETTAALLTEWAPFVGSELVGRALTLVEAHAEAAAGRYAEASALVESAAVTEPEAEAQAALWMLAEVYAARTDGGGGSARGGASTGASRDGTTAVAGKTAEVGTVPTEASLAVYPNPSAGQALVAVALPQAAEVSVVVYDVLGRRVATLAEGRFEAGTHRFRFHSTRLPAGMYLVRAEMEGPATARVFTARLTVVR